MCVWGARSLRVSHHLFPVTVGDGRRCPGYGWGAARGTRRPHALRPPRPSRVEERLVVDRLLLVSPSSRDIESSSSSNAIVVVVVVTASCCSFFVSGRSCVVFVIRRVTEKGQFLSGAVHIHAGGVFLRRASHVRYRWWLFCCCCH